MKTGLPRRASSAASSGSAGSAASPTCWPRARCSPAGRTSTRRGCSGSRRRRAAQIRATANRWLSDGDYTLEVLPYGEYQVAASGVDRSKLPETGTAARRQVPPVRARHALQRAQDRARARARRSRRCASTCCSTPATRPTSSASPAPPASRWRCWTRAPGPARSIGISDELAALGANLSAGSGLDMSGVTLEALKDKLDAVARGLSPT